MKIEKYNQRLLAILGTIGVIFLLVALVAFISEIRWNRNFNNTDTGILSGEKIEELQKENKREQVISYDNPRLIDSLNFIYIIPVSHKTLNEPEDINVNGLLNAKSSRYEKMDSRYSTHIFGAFNNLIVYDSESGTTKKLFNQRVNFSQIEAEYFEDDILLLMNVSEKDTYKDGVINLIDFKTLYVYSFEQKEIKSIGIDGMDVFSYRFLNDRKDIIIRFGLDKNQDGKYEEHNEPTLIKKYDFESGKLIDIIDDKTNSELQRTLEGSEE